MDMNYNGFGSDQILSDKQKELMKLCFVEFDKAAMIRLK